MAQVKLTRGFVAMVDDQDFERVNAFKWQVKVTKGRSPCAQRIQIRPDGSRFGVKMHRFILGAGAGSVVDHRNGDGLDNRRENLRECSVRNNSENRAHYVGVKKARGGFLGVVFQKKSRLWLASIHAGTVMPSGQRRRISLKLYATPEEAARVYDSAASHYFGEFAALNFPGEMPAPFDLSALRGTSNTTPEDRSRIARENVLRAGFRGSRHPRAKLTEADVLAIRASDEPNAVLAKRYNATVNRVWTIRRGIGWRHISTDSKAPPLPRKLTPTEVDIIHRMTSDGASERAVARALGCSRGLVRKQLDARGSRRSAA